MKKKKFVITVEQELEIVIDMDKYNDETVSHVADYWWFSEDKELFFEELAEFLTCNYLKDGYFDSNIEGVAIDGHSGKVGYVNIDIKESE